MNLADMQALVAVVETGSLAHAAVKLNLTQPAVTRRIQRLEESLGTQLLDRDVKPARPTREGKAVYAECVRVLSAADGLRNAVGRDAHMHPLRLAVSLGAADLVLPLLLPASGDAGPVGIEVGRSTSLENAVAERRYDAALVLRDVRSEPHSGEKLARFPVAVVAPRQFGLPERVALQDLRGHRWVICPEGCGYRRQLEHGLYGASQPIDIAAAIWGFDQQARLVAAGAGIGMLPLHTLALSPYAPDLQVIEVSDFRAALDLWLVRAAETSHLDARIAAALRGLRAALESRSQRCATSDACESCVTSAGRLR